MRHPSEIDDLHLDHGPDHSWAGGQLELDEQRPGTALRPEPAHRKWMLLGAGGCAVVTAAAVLLLTRGSTQAHAQAPEREPSAVVAPAPAPESAPTPEPLVGEPSSPEPARTRTLAARGTTLAATGPVDAKPKQAPPAPREPAPAKPSVAPAKPSPSSSAHQPAAAPTHQPVGRLPSADSDEASGRVELPDVAGWDEADAAVEADAIEQPTPEPDADPAEPVDQV